VDRAFVKWCFTVECEMPRLWAVTDLALLVSPEPALARALPIRDASTMTTWSYLAAAAPDLAAIGRGLIYGREIGEALLATVGDDEPPRTSRYCPLDDRSQTTSRRSHPC
jgi:uncharacterized membrane protein